MKNNKLPSDDPIIDVDFLRHIQNKAVPPYERFQIHLQLTFATASSAHAAVLAHTDYPLAQLRFSQKYFKVNYINLQLQGDMNANLTNSEFLAAVNFQDSELQAQFDSYFIIFIYVTEWNYLTQQGNNYFAKTENCSHQNLYKNTQK